MWVETRAARRGEGNLILSGSRGVAGGDCQHDDRDGEAEENHDY